ncbi:MAG: response regulator [Clostridium butyricum]|nr:response regulator [Clostridium butyricum]
MKDVNIEFEDFTAPKAKILIVDDSKVTLSIERDLIKKFCPNITTASSGSEAITLLCSGNSYDIIFIDYMMPEMNGLETAFKIKSLPNLENSILIMLTASSKESLAPHITKDFTDFLEKPIILENLKAILRKYLPNEMIMKSNYKNNTNVSYSNYPKINNQNLKNIDIDKAIKNCGGSLENYYSILSVSYYDGKNKLQILKQLIDNNDIKNYTIEVHALKTVAALIGDYNLSEIAKQHEDAGNAFDYIFIENNFDTLYNEYKNLLERIKPLIDSKNPSSFIKQTKDFNLTSVLNLLIKLDDAIDNFDLDISHELISELLTYKLKPSYTSTLKTVQNYLNIFDYDNSQRLVKNLIDYLS